MSGAQPPAPIAPESSHQAQPIGAGAQAPERVQTRRSDLVGLPSPSPCGLTGWSFSSSRCGYGHGVSSLSLGRQAQSPVYP